MPRATCGDLIIIIIIVVVVVVITISNNTNLLRFKESVSLNSLLLFPRRSNCVPVDAEHITL
jgi:hypothetical protein